MKPGFIVKATFFRAHNPAQVKTMPPPRADLQPVCAGEVGVRTGREATDGAGFDGEDGHLELFAAVGKIDGDGGEGVHRAWTEEKCVVIVASPSERQRGVSSSGRRLKC